MTTYELTYIISPELTSEQIESKEKEIEGAIQKKDGVIVKQTKPQVKTLAYPIGKFSSGFFGIVEFQLEAEHLLEVKTGLDLDSKIVRSMVVVKEAARIRKVRRSRKEEMPSILSDKKPEHQAATEKPEVKVPAFEDVKEEVAVNEMSEAAPEEKKEIEPKGKVELKDIERELGDILGE